MGYGKVLIIFELWVTSELKNAQREFKKSFGRRIYQLCQKDKDSACPRSPSGHITCDCKTNQYKESIIYLDLLYFYCNKIQLTFHKPPLNYKKLNGICEEEEEP